MTLIILTTDVNTKNFYFSDDEKKSLLSIPIINLTFLICIIKLQLS